jgi:hypothetical protein
MYITRLDLISQWIIGDDSYLDWLIRRSQSVFHTMIWLDDETDLLLQERKENLEDIYNTTEIYLKYPKPTTLTSINSEIIPVENYKIIWQKLILKDPVSISSDFPWLLIIIYQAGYETTPEDIKQVLYSMASYFHNMKTSAWISSFSQDLLTVHYWAKEIYDYLTRIGENQIINKYKQYYAYSL